MTTPAARVVDKADPLRHVFAEPLAIALEGSRARRGSVACAIVVAVLLAVLAVRFRGDAASRLSGVPAPRWHWLAACAGATVLFYIANGVSMRAASGLRLELRTVTSVQVAAAATNRIVPIGLGAIAVHLRFLQRRGLTRPAALAAIASIKGAGAASHLLGLLIVAGSIGDSGIGAAVISPVRSTVHDLGAGPVALGFVIVGALGTGTLAHPRVRAVTRPAARVFRAHLSSLAHSPARTAVLLLSQAGTRLCQIFALACAVWSFGASVTLMSVATVYLVGSMVAGAAPTAGGVGALEPALAFGLAAAGGSAASMLAAVLVYRVISFWLPVVPGVFLLANLRRTGNL
ncbi:lysylphosphatidylglycerol synthase transmembrane domain-containing protein [Frankia sp. AgKG'84/4]|uniref:lysylphosphatidylglycerol synthase transmembrane domain-containing protein n=1 Tax=Frankia sp. AgKG'84/4 TaxID=573490 RepID=UPI00200CBDB9|nr:lysylphosphatidylglycerol synthase transmembrane domain-containing protein [Frankia sp. AgKG'84/4]MCL9797369.1 flippase-like domain-containing protein [Frankia sp. AgKG'84/4]